MSKTCVCFGYLRDQYERDADNILDGIEFDHAKAAREEDAAKNEISAVFCLENKQDEKELVEAAVAYANGRQLPRLKSSQRWRFAMRLRFAAALLRPLDKQYIKRGSAFSRRIARVPRAELTLWLLTDGMWFCCETFNEIIFTSERTVSAPIRPPWVPDLSIKRCVDESAKVEEKL